MNKLQEKHKTYKKQIGVYPTEYQQGYLEALEFSLDTIGSCNDCTYSYISGSDLKCEFAKYELRTDGYCNFFEKKYQTEENKMTHEHIKREEVYEWQYISYDEDYDRYRISEHMTDEEKKKCIDYDGEKFEPSKRIRK